MSPVAVTGASGFIGRAFCARASASGRTIRRFVHAPNAASDRSVAIDLTHAGVDELARHLEAVSTVIHLAGRAHVMRETESDADAAYRLANADATERVARAAVAAGVRRFVFASSVKVNGERTKTGRPFRPDDPTAPQDAYARSKRAAEIALQNVARGTPMEAVVLRLPLVHGPGARGDFRRLVDAVRARRILPFGAIDNRRSLAGLQNLLDALDAAIDAPALQGVHFVADAQSVSTPELVRAIARALEVEPRMVRVPVGLLKLSGLVTARSDAVARLVDSLEVDVSSFVAATRWRPRTFAVDL
ncbi:MAG TPA: NAD-dependent epimerase/dehydratase family protein [Casimicrobiaceae bacterium]|nr:NAD-dependent epimerase/dehydratase family protein [Casimicrobiaceae bacterium]